MEADPIEGDPEVDAAWLSDEERRTWASLVTLLMRLPAAIDRQLQSAAGISHFEYGILAGLSEAPDRTVTMSGLAEYANASLSRMSHAVKRLEERGWVTRAPSARDGRLTEASLTESGWRKVVATSPAHVAEVRSLVFDHLSGAEQEQLRAISDTLLEQFRPPCPSGTGPSPT